MQNGWENSEDLKYSSNIYFRYKLPTIGVDVSYIDVNWFRLIRVCFRCSNRFSDSSFHHAVDNRVGVRLDSSFGKILHAIKI